MDENKGYQEDSRSKEETKLPHLKEALNRENLIELGRKGITPFTQILHKYRDEVNPFIEALRTGCEAACKELSTQEAQTQNASRVVCGWFREASTFLEESGSRLSESDPKVFFNYVKDQSNRHPLLMFSSSYLLGLIAGRLSKRQFVEKKSRSLH
ncbi:MAG TPA: hypothetical protein VKY27_10430 [Bacteriovoracaceae bacterium]|nr:hypothetical protein [Bacteriovoracaceae bacterium]